MPHQSIQKWLFVTMLFYVRLQYVIHIIPGMLLRVFFIFYQFAYNRIIELNLLGD